MSNTVDEPKAESGQQPPESSPETGDSTPAERQGKKPPDPVRRMTWLVVVIVVLLFIWYVAADRLAPWTDQARVQAFVVPISPKVSGEVIEVRVVPDQIVKANDVLVRIDPNDYDIAVQRAQADLELAGQDIGASTAAVDAATAQLATAEAGLERARADLNRVLRMRQSDKDAVSTAAVDRAQAGFNKSKSKVAEAEAQREKARLQLGQEGQDNAKIRDAMAALAQARTDLERTTLYAPSEGVITNLIVDEGYYAKAGTPLMTFISGTDVWIEALFRENSIAHMESGDPVDIVLDSAPGKVFRGKVASIGYGVEAGPTGGAGELTTAKSSSGWLRDAQRFPVIIHFANADAVGYRRVGGQADVQVYTGEYPVLNTLGWLWIRLMSWLSYVY